jgi:hypothetical protein
MWGKGRYDMDIYSYKEIDYKLVSFEDEWWTHSFIISISLLEVYLKILLRKLTEAHVK